MHGKVKRRSGQSLDNLTVVVETGGMSPLAGLAEPSTAPRLHSSPEAGAVTDGIRVILRRLPEPSARQMASLRNREIRPVSLMPCGPFFDAGEGVPRPPSDPPAFRAAVGTAGVRGASLSADSGATVDRPMKVRVGAGKVSSRPSQVQRPSGSARETPASGPSGAPCR